MDASKGIWVLVDVAAASAPVALGIAAASAAPAPSVASTQRWRVRGLKWVTACKSSICS